MKSWSAHLIGGSKMQFLGFVEAVSEATAIERAITLSGWTTSGASGWRSI
jgi:hypothetical protein